MTGPVHLVCGVLPPSRDARLGRPIATDGNRYDTSRSASSFTMPSRSLLPVGWALHTYRRFLGIYSYRLSPASVHISHNISRYILRVQVPKPGKYILFTHKMLSHDRKTQALTPRSRSRAPRDGRQGCIPPLGGAPNRCSVPVKSRIFYLIIADFRNGTF